MMTSSTRGKTYQTVKEKIIKKSAKVGVIGLGYVGLPTALEKAKDGYEVIGFDISTEKVNQINRGETYIQDVETNELKAMVEEKRLRATTHFSNLRDIDVLFVCVPTPITTYKEPDLSYVEAAARDIVSYAKQGLVIIFESTTYPGTTRDYFVDPLSKKGWTIGETLFIAYSPERIDPGNPQFGLHNTMKVVGGATRACTELASLSIGKMAYPVSTLEVAEMAKVYENTFRYLNIALVNETTMFCEKAGIDIWEVIEASGTKPHGFMPFYPGPGVGGHCIPVDPYYLSWKAKEMKVPTKMIELSGEINDSMVLYVYNRIVRLLNEQNLPVNGSTIFIGGVAYKKDIDDVRESPVLPIIRILKEAGARVIICDPHVKSFQLDHTIVFPSSYNKNTLQSADLVVLTTDHSAFNYEEMALHAKVILDTRNAFKNVSLFHGYYEKL
jgi:UDP-N-acetyl-D-glucosamine dehydrogenase